MKEKLIKIFTILVFTISTFAEAEYRLGVDSVSYTHLTLPTNREV